MGTDEAKAIYKNRAASAECVNAHSRNRGLQQFRVRGSSSVATQVMSCLNQCFSEVTQPDVIHGDSSCQRIFVTGDPLSQHSTSAGCELRILRRQGRVLVRWAGQCSLCCGDCADGGSALRLRGLK